MRIHNGILLFAVASLASGCIVHTNPRPAPVYAPAPVQQPPPPPPPQRVVVQPMSYQEAVNTGGNYAASRGYQASLQDAHLERNNSVWAVKFTVYRGDARGKMHLQYDAYSRALIRADEKVKDHHGHGHKGNGRWDDEDDDEHEATAVGRPPPGQVINNGPVHGATPVRK